MVWKLLKVLAAELKVSPEGLGWRLRSLGLPKRHTERGQEYDVPEGFSLSAEGLVKPSAKPSEPSVKPSGTVRKPKAYGHMIRVSDEVHGKLQAEAGKLAVKREGRVSLSDVIEAKFNALKAMGFFRKPKKAVEEEPVVVERKEII